MTAKTVSDIATVTAETGTLKRSAAVEKRTEANVETRRLEVARPREGVSSKMAQSYRMPGVWDTAFTDVINCVTGLYLCVL